MIVWYVAGAVAAGTGVMLLFSGVFARALPLAVLANDDRNNPNSTESRSGLEVFAGDASTRLASDLAVCDRTAAKFGSDRVVNAATFALLPFVGLVLSVTGNIGFSPLLMAAVTAAAAAAGWWYTTPALKRSADEARKDFEASLVTYFELVSLAFSGGKGAHDALREPATVGTGPAFEKLRLAMVAGDERRRPPWETLVELGESLGIQSLVDLGASITVAADGAPVVDTLRAKAETMRDQGLAAQEARAEARSETLGVPIVMMFCGFLILFGYPALAGLLELR